ncbi:BnaC02g29550D [Brassica napus]|uniref:BnaC02g29550D protein n=1 Tax=Brassica napus TaxID=3708 RepID=A0A078GGZ5_BRANA|nr:BnaC02g29550D [Brassica napus]
MVDEDVVDGQLSPDNILKDYLDSQAGGSSSEQFNIEGLLEFDFPPTEGGSSEVPEITKAARMVNGVGSHLLTFSDFYFGRSFLDFENFCRAFL